ncbi:DUF2087 domain-containing protein [Natronosporangium hydrolyticum]|uniref:DUF2087 domain-containing protein n=1 Tax=Natronosporangium hydrolyticum TaxID=2811111 RepID=A0A895YSM0_9ACTN|nr:DUF2087 domain-containing protein [Natronosporangium hydrolyticum]
MCGLLAEPDRLAVFAAVTLGATTPDQVAKTTGTPLREVMAALRRLERAGLLYQVDGALTADREAFKRAVRETAATSPPAEPLDADPARDTILQTFLQQGRLTQLPAAWGKRRVVLEHIVAAFEPGVRYPEREVDATLRAWHPDYASLRRHLVDEELMAREAGTYWRIGGPTLLTD